MAPFLAEFTVIYSKLLIGIRRVIILFATIYAAVKPLAKSEEHLR